jgi:hypothetical protein
MTDPVDLHTETAEFPDDASYAWWLNSNPGGFVLAVRARHAPILHRARCPEVDRDRHGGRLHATGSRQICALTAGALRGWAKRELPEAPSVLARCPKCGS